MNFSHTFILLFALLLTCTLHVCWIILRGYILYVFSIQGAVGQRGEKGLRGDVGDEVRKIYCVAFSVVSIAIQ